MTKQLRLSGLWLGGLDEGSQAGLPYIYHAGVFYREVAALHTLLNTAR